jgi:cytochrome c oxidase subunit 2
VTVREPHRYLPIAAIVIGGCGEQQSVLNPAGPEALRLAQLTWLLFGFGAAVLGIVILAAVAAVRGPEQVRAALASARMVVWAGILFPSVALTGLLGYGVWVTRASIADPSHEGMLRIAVTGEQWWWRVHYAQPAGYPVAAANEIRIPVGRSILFELRSADVIHSFWVPNLGGKVDMIPGRTTFLRLRANQVGIFRGQCAEYCGGPHALMALEVVAMSPVEFDTWLQNQARPATDPETTFARRGRELFFGAGCGACHAVRGTAAAGTIGPDLTHLGSRRSVGIDTAAVSEAAIARFISDGQHIKPGNRMPPFRIFAPDDLGAIAAYLAGLR